MIRIGEPPGTRNVAALPREDAEFFYGRPMKGHSWHAFTWAEMVRRIAAKVGANAPFLEG